MFSFILSISYYPTLISAMSGVICYITGIKKGKQIAIGSGVIYFVLSVLEYSFR